MIFFVLIFFVYLIYFNSVYWSGYNSAQNKENVRSFKVVEQPRDKNEDCNRFFKVKPWLEVRLISQFRLLRLLVLNN